MSKSDQTRQFIIEKTASIFNKKGYAGTALSDITEATGLTKGSIYGNFKNKDEVILEVFKYSTNELSKKTDDWIAGHKNAYDTLISLTEFYRNNWNFIFKNGGCPMLNAATEVDDILPFMKTTVQRSFYGWATKFSAIIEQGKSTKEFKEKINAIDYANTFIMLIEGGILLSKISDKPDYLYLALDRILKIINDEIVI
jgi:TetR/AcrR family transcriptional repressor of nem operon